MRQKLSLSAPTANKQPQKIHGKCNLLTSFSLSPFSAHYFITLTSLPAGTLDPCSLPTLNIEKIPNDFPINQDIHDEESERIVLKVRVAAG